MTEDLLHYAWRHKMYDPCSLFTTDGEQVEVINPGQWNRDAGPDFFNAKLKIAGVLWAGNVEMHLNAAQWYKHRHEQNPAYNNTILHAVAEAAEGSADVLTNEGRKVPTVVLKLPQVVEANYRRLMTIDEYPRCHEAIPSISKLKVTSWLSTLLTERLQERADLVQKRADEQGGDWEKALFITLARNFGFGKNGDEFELWARQLPLEACAHHRDNEMQIEAIFLGTAGLLTNGPQAHYKEAQADEYRSQLLREYEYLRKKYSLPETIKPNWRFLRMRPQAFPNIRIVQLANLYCKGATRLSSIIESTTIKQLQDILSCQVSDYWKQHYTFGCQTPEAEKRLTASTRKLIVINTVVPVLWAYGQHQNRPLLHWQALSLLQSLKNEENYITRQWQACGINVSTAADTQALIQLKLTRCDKYDCLRCRFAYEVLSKKI